MKLAGRILPGLEPAVLLGLGPASLLSGRAVKTINRQSAVAQPMAPAPTATALIRLAELPAGSHLPVEQDSLQPPTPLVPPNIHINVTSQPLPAVAVPTPAPQQARHISILATGVEAPFVYGVVPASLRLGAGHYEGSSDPGERGNLVFAGHNETYGEVFRDLDRLKPGDEVTVYTASQSYRYPIRGWRIVEPTEVGVLEPTLGPTLTLISYYSYLVDTERIVVFGELVGGYWNAAFWLAAELYSIGSISKLVRPVEVLNRYSEIRR